MPLTSIHVAVCEDDALYRQTLQAFLPSHFSLQCTATGAALLQQVQRRRPDAVLLDLQLGASGAAERPWAAGLQTLAELQQLCPDVPVLVHSGFADAPAIVAAMRLGAHTYLPKAAGLRSLAAEIEAATAAARCRTVAPPSQLLGDSPPMQALRRQIAALRRFAGHVIVQGETGVGKELVARQLGHPGRPFVAVDCATLAPATADSLLFGHARGAFTGAATAHRGLLQAADGGSLFFDEVANMHLEVQAKLLRALQEQEVRPLGSATVQPVHVSVICATHADLQASVAAGQFRNDLLQRLQVFVLQVPPLRQRRADIPLLLEHFLRRAWQRAVGSAAAVPQPTEALLARLTAYEWPGNVRQLANVATAMLPAAQGSRLDQTALPTALLPARPVVVPVAEAAVSCRAARRQAEQQSLRQAYAQAAGNVSLLARRLRCDRSRLHRKLVAWQIHRPRAQPDD